MKKSSLQHDEPVNAPVLSPVTLLIASALSIAFVITLAVAMLELLGHHQLAKQTANIGIYGLTLVLMLIHAVHILGGLIPLNMLAVRVWRNHRMTSRDQHNVRSCAMYWHFLEVVWLSMFAFLLLG